MTSLSKDIAASTDDGQAGSGAGYATGNSPITLGGYFGTANGWFRFTNVTIPSGATINSATFTAAKRATAAGTADLIYNFVKEANPSYPTSDSDYNGRTLTTANATHSVSGATGTLTSPSLTTALQEIIDQGSWASGNAVILFVRDNGSNANHGGFENRVSVKSYDESSTLPKLAVDYSSTSAISGSATLTFAAGSSTLTGSGALAGVAAIAVTPTATLAGAGALAGEAAIVLTPTATLAGAGSLAGEAAIVFTPTATLQGNGELAGTAAATFEPAAFLQGLVNIAGTSTFVFSASGQGDAFGALAGSAALTFAAGSSTLTGSGALVGAIDLVVTPAATLVGSAALAGIAAVVLTPTATLSGVGAIAGQATVVFTATMHGIDSIAGAAALAFGCTSTITYLAPGPFRSVSGQSWMPGMVEAQVHSAGIVAGQHSSPGSSSGQSHP